MAEPNPWQVAGPSTPSKVEDPWAVAGPSVPSQQPTAPAPRPTVSAVEPGSPTTMPRFAGSTPAPSAPLPRGTYDPGTPDLTAETEGAATTGKGITGSPRDIATLPERFYQGLVHKPAATIGRGLRLRGTLINKLGETHPVLAGLIQNRVSPFTSADQDIATGEDVEDRNVAWQKGQDNFLREKLGVNPESTIGKTAGFGGDIGAGVVKAGGLGVLAIPAFAAEGAVDKAVSEIDKGTSLGKAVAAGTMSGLAAATIMKMAGGNAKQADALYSSFTKLIARKATAGVGMGVIFGTTDSAIDRYVLGKDVTLEEWGSTVLESIKTMLGYELAGGIAPARLMMRSREFTKEYATPGDAKAALAPKLIEATRRLAVASDKDTPAIAGEVDRLKGKMAAIMYAEKAGIPFKGKTETKGGKDINDAMAVVEAAKKLAEEKKKAKKTKGVDGAIPEQGANAEVPRDGEVGGNLPESGQGVGQGIEGQAPSREGEAQTQPRKEPEVATQLQLDPDLQQQTEINQPIFEEAVQRANELESNREAVVQQYQAEERKVLEANGVTKGLEKKSRRKAEARVDAELAEVKDTQDELMKQFVEAQAEQNRRNNPEVAGRARLAELERQRPKPTAPIANPMETPALQTVTTNPDAASAVTEAQPEPAGLPSVAPVTEPSPQAVPAPVEPAPAPVVPKPVAPVPPPPEAPSPTLPKDLRGAKPRFNAGVVGHSPVFERDVDKALFIVSQDKPSKSDAKYMDWLKKQFPGRTEAWIRARGQEVRAEIKALTKGKKQGGDINIPDQGHMSDRTEAPKPKSAEPTAQEPTPKSVEDIPNQMDQEAETPAPKPAAESKPPVVEPAKPEPTKPEPKQVHDETLQPTVDHQVPEALRHVEGLRVNGEVFTIPVAKLRAAPKRFQFRVTNSNTGIAQIDPKSGESGSTSGAKHWNDRLAKFLDVWLDPADGEVYVVNGHNRRSLAIKLGEKDLNVRFIKADTAEEAKAIGAYINMSEGSGTAMDAAHYIRHTGATFESLEADGLPMDKPMIRDGLALAKLSDEMFEEAGRSKDHERLAIEVGRAKLNEKQQAIALAEMRKKDADSINTTDWKDKLGRIKAATVSSGEVNMFGEEELVSTLDEQAEIVKAVRASLSSEKTVASTATSSKHAAARAKGGIEVAGDAAEMGKDAKLLLSHFERMKDLSGPVGEAINENAVRLQNAGSQKERERILSESVSSVRESVRGDLGKTSGRTEPAGSRHPGDEGAVQGEGQEPVQEVAPKPRHPPKKVKGAEPVMSDADYERTAKALAEPPKPAKPGKKAKDRPEAQATVQDILPGEENKAARNVVYETGILGENPTPEQVQEAVKTEVGTAGQYKEGDVVTYPKGGKFVEGTVVKEKANGVYEVKEKGGYIVDVVGAKMAKHGMTPRATADFMGGQQIYEKALRGLGLDADATIPEISRAIREKIGGIGKTVAETASRIMEQVKDISSRVAEKLAKFMHSDVSGKMEMLRPARDTQRHIDTLVGKLKAVDTDLRSILAPSTVSKDSLRANDILRQGQAHRALEISRVWESIMGPMRILDKAGRRIQNLVTDAIEDPEIYAQVKKPALKAFIDQIKQLQDAVWQGIVDRGGEVNYWENYLHMAYKNPEEAKAAIAKANLHGNLSYMLEREGPKTHKIARDLGLAFQENNPARIVLSDIANKLKYIYAHDAMEKAINEGLVVTDIPGYGVNMVELDNHVAQAVTGDKSTLTKYYAEPSVARIFNNALQPGFGGNILYGGARFFNNTMNQVELGLSPFHAMVISNEIAASMVGIGVRDIIQGNAKKGLEKIATGLTPVLAQAQVCRRGTELIDIIKKGGEIPEEYGGEEFRNYLELAGGRVQQDPEYINNIIDKMRVNWAESKEAENSKGKRAWLKGKAAIQVPFAAIEAGMRPIMEHYVPAAKIGIFNLMYLQERPFFPADATEAEVAANARRNWDQVENTMGQLTYDNIAWNTKFKQISMLAFRAVGWKVGSKRAIYGSAVDLAKAVPMTINEIRNQFKMTRQTQEKIDQQIAKSRAQGDFAPHAQFTQRLGWAFGQATVTVLTNAALMAIHAAYTRKKEDLPLAGKQGSGKDLIYARLGKDSAGNPTRIAIPGYTKEAIDDQMSWERLLLHGSLRGFGEQIYSASSPLVHTGVETATGEDFMGNKIKSRMGNVASKFVPITVAAGVNERKKGGTWGQAATAMLKSGFVQKPKEAHLRSDAQNRIMELWNKVKPKRTQDFSDQLAEARGLYERKTTKQDFNETAAADLSPKAKKAMKKSDLDKMTFSVASRLGHDEVVDIFENYATDEEKVKLMPALATTYNKVFNETRPSERKALKERYEKIKAEVAEIKRKKGLAAGGLGR